MINYLKINGKLTEEEILNLVKEKGLDNLVVKKLSFNNIEEAEEYLGDMVNENRSVFVKYYKSAGSFEETDTYKDLVEKLENSKENLNNFPESILEKLQEQKSGSKGCGNCKSSISKDYLIKNIETNLLELKNNNLNTLENKMKEIYCPICKDKEFLISETDKKKLTSLENKFDESNNKIKESKRIFETKVEKIEEGIIGYKGDIIVLDKPEEVKVETEIETEEEIKVEIEKEETTEVVEDK